MNTENGKLELANEHEKTELDNEQRQRATTVVKREIENEARKTGNEH